jgi:hypothetical protein
MMFAAHHAFSADGTDVIEIDPRAIAARVEAIERESGRALTPEERRGVERSYVDERILVREALAMGLDDDPRIHDVLVQKMLHVLSADVIQPTDAELSAYYAAHRARYTPEPTATVDEVVIAATGAAPGALVDRLRAGEPPAAVAGSEAVRHNPLGRATLRTLSAVFGAETAGTIFEAEIDSWVGPHPTVRGEHWFRVTERSAPEPPPLEIVRDQVRLDWIGEEEEARLAARVSELRERYSIVFEAAPEP